MGMSHSLGSALNPIIPLKLILPRTPSPAPATEVRLPVDRILSVDHPAGT